MRTRIVMAAIAAFIGLGTVQFGPGGWQITEDGVDLLKRGSDCIKNCG